MRARRLSGTIWHVPRLALLAVVVLAISPRRNRGRVAHDHDLGYGRHRDGALRRRRGRLLRLGDPQGAHEPTSRSATSRARLRPAARRSAAPESIGLLRLPRAAVLLDRAQAGGLHDHEPRQQPRPRLRRVGPGRDDRRAQAGRPSLHGPPGRDRRPAERRDEGRVRRLRAVPVGAEPARHRGRREPRAEGRPEGRHRRGDDARRRRRIGPAARARPGRSGSSASRAATSSPSPTPSSAPGRTSLSATARTSSAGSSGTADA